MNSKNPPTQILSISQTKSWPYDEWNGETVDRYFLIAIGDGIVAFGIDEREISAKINSKTILTYHQEKPSIVDVCRLVSLRLPDNANNC